jgi:SAM-dependent methyltransferase
MEELDHLAERFGTDKGTIKTGSLSPKGYTRHYARYFAPLREKPIQLLEIGIASGASLKMWEAYFPRAAIHGIDIDPSCRSIETERVRAFIGDQEDRAFLRTVVSEIGGALDIVIDDGGHRMSQHMTALEELFPALKPGGIYVIEDLHTSYWALYGGGYRKAGSTVEFLKGLVDNVTGGAGVMEDGSRWQRFTARYFGRRPGELPSALERLDSVHFCPSIAFLLAK